ncbi:MAG: hypothetical protein QOD77_1285 [Thermoplasmata archaeon]|jgi:hypothetical protein|nr:hypothetical protein [Thermoplasmata archaeon]
MQRILLATAALAVLAFFAPTATATGSDECPDHPADLLADVSYTVDGTTYASLDGNVVAGAVVTVTFTTTQGCEALYSLVSYNADADFDLESQTVFDSETVETGVDTYTLTVTVPDCYFQVDFVGGAVIEHFTPPEGTYHGEGRFIAGDTGGDTECLPPPPELACPTDLAGFEAPQGSMSISWTQAEGATGYRVYLAVGDGDLEMVHEGDATLAGYGIAPVEAGVVYTFKVTALYGDAESEGCETLELTGIPEFPTGIAVVAAGVLGTVGYAVMLRRRKA